ncbi:MAG: helix-turn-helix domain-containing protein [Lentisphaeria bacterium]|nr:helix-turn-helix domain-containing protein [Lentisphaeria bacterium]
MNIPNMEPRRIQLVYWGYAEGKAGMHIPPHAHSCWQTHFTLSGSCRLRTDEGDFLLHDQDMIFLAPGVRHTLTYPESYLCYSCKFQADLFGLPPVIHSPGSKFTRGVIQTVKTILETSFPSRFFGVPEGTMILPGDHYQLLMEYFLTGVLATFRQARMEQSPVIARIHQLIETQGKPFFSVAEAAEACGCSRNHFSLLVRKETGMSARNYLNCLRLECARKLLLHTDQNIGEIALQLGFSSPFHFSDFFKRMSGVSPLRFRKSGKE